VLLGPPSFSLLAKLKVREAELSLHVQLCDDVRVSLTAIHSYFNNLELGGGALIFIASLTACSLLAYSSYVMSHAAKCPRSVMAERGKDAHVSMKMA